MGGVWDRRQRGEREWDEGEAGAAGKWKLRGNDRGLGKAEGGMLGRKEAGGIQNAEGRRQKMRDLRQGRLMGDRKQKWGG